MFRYEYGPLFDDLNQSSLRRSRIYSVALNFKRKRTFIVALITITLLIIFGLVRFLQRESHQTAQFGHQECRQIKVCSVCIDEGCVWTNSSKYPCRYDGSDFEQAVAVPCLDNWNQREFNKMMTSLKAGHGRRLEWSLGLQIISYVLGIVYITTRFYLRGHRRPFRGWQHPNVMYRPLERVLSGDVDNVELISLI